MRIDAYMQVNQLYQSEKTKKTSSVGVSSDRLDKFEISDFGKDLRVAKQAVSDAPEVRENKINELKSTIASGTYDMSMERLADKLANGFSLFD